jgi:DNA polymerase-3 subunit alpha
MSLGKTQRGDTFARFTLEDYNGNIEMAIFSKDYINFAPFISAGNFLYINGKIQKKWKSETDYELKPTMFKLLSEIKAEKTKGIQLNINVKVINEALIQHLENLTAANVGKLDFKVNIKTENMTVELFSRKIRVDTTMELLKELDLIEGLTYKILAS